ncbi:MAG: cation:proton antiporter [Synechococcaceae cyanobacterium]
MVAAPSLLATLLILLLGVLCARFSAGRLVRWSVPAIVLELLLGVLLGQWLLPSTQLAPLSGLSELGVLTLFFQVGLEVRGDLLGSRRAAILRTVAISCLAPLLAVLPLRFGLALPWPATVIALAALAATGTGVTLRVLTQKGALDTPSGRLLVGVSVLDDLPAIALLALAGVVGVMAGSTPAPSGIGGVPGAWRLLLGPALGVALAVVSHLACGWWLRRGGRGPQGALEVLLLLIGWAWLGEVCGLTSLLGALWGGVLLARLSPETSAPDGPVRSQLAVITEVFLPIYFIGVGLRLPLSSLSSSRAWQLAAVLVICAVLSKLACGLGISRRDRAGGIDPWLVIYGLMPRGLPGLVFATTARANGLIDADGFAAVVLMVCVTTVVGLMLLERRLGIRSGGGGAPGPTADASPELRPKSR